MEINLLIISILQSISMLIFSHYKNLTNLKFCGIYNNFYQKINYLNKSSIFTSEVMRPV